MQLLGEGIWDKNCIFQDNIGVWYTKHSSKNIMTPFALECFESDYMEMGYEAKTAFSKITQGCGVSGSIEKCSSCQEF